MGFENAVHRSLDNRNPGEHPVIIEMHKKAEKILRDDAINPHDFIDLYGEENVARDIQKIESLKAKFEHDEIKRVAEVFEAMVYQHTELSDWLGPNAETIRPSEYDDIVNGIDLIVEFNNEDFTKHLALGVDVTFGSQTIGKKMERIKAEITSDELATVKYFESHGFKGSLKQVPRVVIGLEKDTVISLAALWMRNQNAELGDHFAKDVIMKEIVQQLQTFLEYAIAIESEKAARSYTQALATLKSTTDVGSRERLIHSREHAEEIKNDRVFKDIQGYLEGFKIPSPEK